MQVAAGAVWGGGGAERYTHHDAIPDDIFKVIKPIYLRLTERSLLERCLHGATQNRNECLNGLVWQMCPKTGICSAKVTEAAVALAVFTFNDGSSALGRLMTAMGMPEGEFTALAQLDEERQKDAERKRSIGAKSRRKKRRRVRMGIQEDKLDDEGVTYEAGGF